MWGKYWEGTLYNDYRNVQLDPIAEDITSKFIKTLPQFHSVYIRGSHVEKTTSEYSDIDYLVVSSNTDQGRWYYGCYNDMIDGIDVDVRVMTEKEFCKCPDERFLEFVPLKCVAGKDMSLAEIDLHSIKHDYVDKSKTLRNMLDNPVCNGYVKDEYTSKKYIKKLLRCCFDTVGPKLGIHTRSLSYCQYFFAQEVSEYARLTAELLCYYLNNKEYDTKLISDSEILIDLIANGRHI